jgi:hypothetical protein
MDKGHDDARPHQGRCCFGKMPTRIFLTHPNRERENGRGLSDRGQTKPTSQKGAVRSISTRYYMSNAT